MTIQRLSRYLPILAFCAALAVLIIWYLWTLQTIPNGSDHPLMIDVGETQIVLNVWGTLHATGYPHYVITGNILTSLLRLVGVSAATAPAVVSLVWGIAALVFTYALMFRLSRRAWLSALVLMCFGLTRMVWLHNSIAEIYTFGLALLAAMLYIALGMTGRDTARLYGLALLGGMAIAHHRALALAIPALVYAMWIPLTVNRRLIPRHLLICAALGLFGFLPYIYLPLRETAGAAWVYGEPNTLQGFLDQFLGREASRFIGSATSIEALIANIQRVNEAILTDVTLIGLIAGMVGLGLGIRNRSSRRAAIALTLLGISAYLFHVLVYTDILVMLVLMITLPLAFGWLFVGMWVVSPHPQTLSPLDTGGRYEAWKGMMYHAPTAVVLILFAVLLIFSHAGEISALTSTRSNMRDMLGAAPQNATAMIAWGTQFFDAGFEHDVNGLRPDMTLVDHKADYHAILEDGQQLITPNFTFYNQPVSWWEAQIGAPMYLTTVAPNWVNIALEPRLDEGGLDENLPVTGLNPQVICDPESDTISLQVDWVAPHPLEKDYSVFVHFLSEDGSLIGQADQAAPVYGWRPTTSWQAREIVRDVYPFMSAELSNPPTGIRYGLYEQLPDGSFNNVVEYDIPLDCP